VLSNDGPPHGCDAGQGRPPSHVKANTMRFLTDMLLRRTREVLVAKPRVRGKSPRARLHADAWSLLG